MVDIRMHVNPTPATQMNPCDNMTMSTSHWKLDRQLEPIDTDRLNWRDIWSCICTEAMIVHKYCYMLTSLRQLRIGAVDSILTWQQTDGVCLQGRHIYAPIHVQASVLEISYGECYIIVGKYKIYIYLRASPGCGRRGGGGRCVGAGHGCGNHRTGAGGRSRRRIGRSAIRLLSGKWTRLQQNQNPCKPIPKPSTWFMSIHHSCRLSYPKYVSFSAKHFLPTKQTRTGWSTASSYS